MYMLSCLFHMFLLSLSFIYIPSFVTLSNPFVYRSALSTIVYFYTAHINSCHGIELKIDARSLFVSGVGGGVVPSFWSLSLNRSQE